MNATAVVVAPQESQALNSLVDPDLGHLSQVLMMPDVQNRLKSVLPTNIPVDRFIQIAQMAALSMPDIKNATPTSIIKGLIQCAKDGLVPDGREAALVVYKGEVAYQPMIDGVLKRIRLSGQVKNIFAKVVYHGDFFDYGVNESGEYLRHKPSFDTDRSFDNIMAVYAVAKLESDEKVIEVMTKEEVDRIMYMSKGSIDRSTGKVKPYSVWGQHYDRMAIKTVLHRLCRRLPNASEVAQMLERDIQYDTERLKSQQVAQAEAQAEANAIAQQYEAISDEQVAALRSLMAEVNTEEMRFCSFLSGRLGSPITSIDQLPASWFETAVQMLEKKRNKAQDVVAHQ